ncbi:Vi polysaccharide biosynthesis UDP-N-acetylglucosamine C-6 dehydrogenase TviB [Acidovorax sp. A79]|uniref:nucleotide sugar dehydrogenase n=1 Tax=Acidovorax sp. A79 TaxID=3056107 RepID=UPI0034E8546D
MLTLITTQSKIAIIGLGYVGLPLAVEFSRHHPVVGFDTHQQRILELQAGYDRTHETSAQQLEDASQLQYSSNPDDLQDCNVYIVTVPTPVDDANRPDLSMLINASQSVGHAMRSGALVIYESTVYPGVTEEVCVPVLEKYSGLRFNRDFFCGYSPERVNPGDKVNTITRIRKITSGSTPEAAEAVDQLYCRIITAGTYKAPSIKVAEAAKVIENTQRDLNIALMNELSILFDRLEIDTLDVLEAAGSKWNFVPFRPGLVGGHCIGVDPYYLTYKAEQVGYHPQIILAGRRINDNMAGYAARNTIKMMLHAGMDAPRCKIGVLGITFKENCPDIRNSKVVNLVRELEAWGMEVVISDPIANAAEVHHEYQLTLGLVDEDHPVDALVVAVGHNSYRALSASQLRSYCRHPNPVLADIKSLYDREELFLAGFTVYRL